MDSNHNRRGQTSRRVVGAEMQTNCNFKADKCDWSDLSSIGGTTVSFFAEDSHLDENPPADEAKDSH